MQVDRVFVTEEKVFTSVPRIMFSDVLALVEAEYTGTELRDARSAFRMLQQNALRRSPTLLRPQRTCVVLCKRSLRQLLLFRKNAGRTCVPFLQRRSGNMASRASG